jgi:hypothetical protein
MRNRHYKDRMQKGSRRGAERIVPVVRAVHRRRNAKPCYKRFDRAIPKIPHGRLWLACLPNSEGMGFQIWRYDVGFN